MHKNLSSEITPTELRVFLMETPKYNFKAKFLLQIRADAFSYCMLTYSADVYKQIEVIKLIDLMKNHYSALVFKHEFVNFATFLRT